MKVLSIKIDLESPETGLEQVVQEVRPEWKNHSVKYNKFPGGFVNQTYYCYLEDDMALQDAIVIRIAPEMVNHKQYMWPTEDEAVYNLQVTQHTQCGPPVLAFFRNGYCTKYSGKNVTRRTMRDPQIIQKAARLLAQLHSFDPETASLVNAQGDIYPIPRGRKAVILERLHSLMTFIPEPGKEWGRYPSDEAFRKDVLQQELDFAEKYLNNLNIKTVMSHNDLNMTNMLYDKNTGEVFFVDFDYQGFNYEGWDFSQLCLERDYFIAVGALEADDPGPLDDDTMRVWIKHYLIRKAELEGKSSSSVTNRAIEIQLLKTKIMMPFFSLYVTIYLVANANTSLLKADPILVARAAHKQYQELKPKLGKLVEEYQALQKQWLT